MRSRRRSRSERAALAAFALFALFAFAREATAEEALRAGVFSPAREAPDFTLKGSNGEPLEMKKLRGKVVVLEFGFTSCPDVCPVTLKTLAEAHRKLGAKADQLQVVYVTVDPERDDAGKLKSYLAFFDPSFLGGTGSDAELSAVRQAYGILASRVTEGDSYRFSHSSFTYLIDRSGMLRALMPYGQKPDDYVHDLGILIDEPAGAAALPPAAPQAPAAAAPAAQ